MNYPDGSSPQDMAQYVGMLRRRWWVVVGLVCVGLVGALAYVAVTPKAYTSTASVYVTPTGADQSSQLANARTSGAVNLDTEAQLVKSSTVATIVARTLHSSLPPYQLSQEISVTVPPNSQILQIACKAPSATGAADCANAFAKAYLQNRSTAATTSIDAQIRGVKAQVTSLQGTVATLNTKISALPTNSPTRLSDESDLSSATGQLHSLNGQLATLESESANHSGGSVVTAATPPSKPSSPKKSLALPGGLVVGLLLGLIAAFVWDRRDKRIHGPQQVETQLGVPVIFDPPGKAFGRQPSLASPRSRAGKAFTELANTVAASLGDGSHVLLVAGTSRGAGTSVVAANLAATLARTHDDTVLVCARRDSVAPELFGLTGRHGLADVASGHATVAEIARGPAEFPGLWVIPPGSDMSLADYHLRHDMAKALTSQLRRDAGYVVIEAQATEEGADNFTLAEFSDTALLVVEVLRTTTSVAGECIRRLLRVHTKVIGAATLPAMKSPDGMTAARPAQTRPAGQSELRRPGTADGLGEITATAGPEQYGEPDVSARSRTRTRRSDSASNIAGS